MSPNTGVEPQPYYSRRSLWNLFLVSALPIHIWTYFQFFADFSWISARTNVWDAVAVGSYGLLTALLESALVALCAAALGMLVSRKWDRDTRMLLMGTLAALAAVWAMLAQYYFYAALEVPGWVYRLTLVFPRPLWMLMALAGAAVGATILPAAWLIIRYDGVRRGLRALFDRLNLLMSIYLLVDLAALAVIVFRNV